MMKNTKKKFDVTMILSENSAQLRKLLTVISIIGIVGCVLVLIPQIRSAILVFGDIARTHIMHRPLSLNVEIWNQLLLSSSIFGLFLSVALLFIISRQFSRIQFPTKKRNDFYLALEILLISLFFVMVLLLAASNSAIWVDEAYSLAPIRHTWQEMLRFERGDVHPPLFFIIEKVWSMMFGEGVFIMKLLSILPTVATLVITELFLNKEFSRKHGVLFLLCCIASKSIIHYSIEIRMYAWALFFVTMMALCAWYIITSGKTRWWALFLICAEAAAYTHYYAAAVCAIGYMLLLCYIIKCDIKKILPALLVIPAAVLLYLPWLPAALNAFSGASNDFWIEPITIKTIAYYVLFIFNAGNAFTPLGFFMLFFAVFCVFIARRGKTKADYFALGGLCCIIILAVVGILISLLTRPLLVERYLFPACGLVWIFFAIACAPIQNKRIVTFVYICLFSFDVMTAYSSFYTERKENSDFNQFYTYFSEHITPDDMFIFPQIKHDHLRDVIAYLFPGHIRIAETAAVGAAYEEAFNVTRITYTDVISTQQYRERGAWVIVAEQDAEKKASIETFLDTNTEYHGFFGWGGYKFKLYYTNSPAVVAERLK
jgi:uncharacterized membrane protein